MSNYWLNQQDFSARLPMLKKAANNQELWKKWQPKDVDTDLEIEVSSFGRVRQYHRILPLQEIEDGYLYARFDGYEKCKVYRLVAETWCSSPDKPKEFNVVHHIDNNGYNNTPENLIWVTQEQHCKIHRL